MNKKQIKLFESFLAGELAFLNFVTNVQKTENTIDKSYQAKYEEVILGAFGWDYTPEGFEYWDKLNDAWVKYIRNLKQLK